MYDTSSVMLDGETHLQAPLIKMEGTYKAPVVVEDLPEEAVEEEVVEEEESNSFLDNLQLGLDIVGLIPGLGEVADLANGVISLARGDYLGAALSFASMIPFAGWGATAAKAGIKAAKAAKKAKKVAKVLDKGAQLARATGNVAGVIKKGRVITLASKIVSKLKDLMEAIKKLKKAMQEQIIKVKDFVKEIPNYRIEVLQVATPDGLNLPMLAIVKKEGKDVASGAGGKIGKGTGNASRLIPGTPGKVTGGSSTKLGKNMFEEMGLPRSTKRTPYQAQHIIPAEFNEHPVIQKIGMDMDHASNGFFLRIPDEYVSATSRHQGYHSVYSDFVESKLNKIDINQDIDVIEKQVFELQQKLRKLQEKGLPLYKTDVYLQQELKKIKSKGLEEYKLDRANNKDKIKPVWDRGGGATIDLWERWFDKL